MDILSLDDIWQETLGLDDFDAGWLEAAMTRNQRPAYGLTLVAHPLRQIVSPLAAVRQACPEQSRRGSRRVANLSYLRSACEQALPCSFFPEEILHFTIYSLRRSRPEPFYPAELEGLWDRLVCDLGCILEATPPFDISLRGLAVTVDGAILIGADDSPVLCRLRQAMEAIPEVSPPRSYPPHVTIGQVLAPCGSAERFQQTLGGLRAWQSIPMGAMSVSSLKLVYYSSRLLVNVEREAELVLGKGSISGQKGRDINPIDSVYGSGIQC